MILAVRLSMDVSEFAVIVLAAFAVGAVLGFAARWIK